MSTITDPAAGEEEEITGMFFSQFVVYFTANRRYIPAAIAEAIRRDALNRIAERQRTGYAESPLLFDDLIEQIERAAGGLR